MLVLLVSLCASVAIEPVGKLKRLLQDVQETVRKSATDESVTIASAETFSQHLDLSLVKEIAALNRTLDTLQQAHHKQETDVASAELNLQHLHEAQDGSNTLATNYAAGSTNVGKKYSSVMMSLKALVALLKTSVVTPDGTLVTQAEPDEHGQATEVLRAIRTVLVSHKSAVSAPLLAAFNSTTPTLRPDLLEELVRTLEGIEREVDGRRVEALAQLDAKTRRYRSDAQLTASESEKRAGFLAESRRQVQDVVYAVEFTKAVVAKDEELRVKLAAFTATEDKVKRDLKILRGRQETALKDLLLLLDGQFKPNTKIVPTPPEALPADMQHREWLWEDHKAAPVSFLQVRPPQAGLVGIRSQIETALSHKQDTHDILMRIQESLQGQRSSAPDAENIRQVLAGLQNLRAEIRTTAVSSSALDSACAAESARLQEGTAAADASAELMTTAAEHLHTTSDAAEANVGGIERKRMALSKLVQEADAVYNQTRQSLGLARKDRETVLTALNKAHMVAARVLPTEEAGGLTLLEQLVSLFESVGQVQDVQEQAETDLHVSLAQYSADYSQLLEDRTRHYTETLATVGLTFEELDRDRGLAKETQSSLQDLSAADQGLCQQLRQHFAAKTARRDRLAALLDQVMPKIPDLLNVR